MKSHQTRGLQAFRRIEAWFAEHPQVITASGSSAAALSNQVDALKLIVASMTARATEQASQTGQATLAAKDEAKQRHELRGVRIVEQPAILRHFTAKFEPVQQVPR